MITRQWLVLGIALLVLGCSAGEVGDSCGAEAQARYDEMHESLVTDINGQYSVSSCDEGICAWHRCVPSYETCPPLYCTRRCTVASDCPAGYLCADAICQDRDFYLEPVYLDPGPRPDSGVGDTGL